MDLEVPMPKVGELMEEGEILEWLVQIGDEVEAQQPIAVVETDKVSVEIESPYTGLVVSIVVPPGEVASVGEAICVVRTKS